MFAVADAAKLTMPMRLPEPIVPSVDLVGIDGFICECNARACLLLAFDMVILCERRQEGHKKERDDLQKVVSQET